MRDKIFEDHESDKLELEKNDYLSKIETNNEDFDYIAHHVKAILTGRIINFLTTIVLIASFILIGIESLKGFTNLNITLLIIFSSLIVLSLIVNIIIYFIRYDSYKMLSVVNSPLNDVYIIQHEILWYGFLDTFYSIFTHHNVLIASHYENEQRVEKIKLFVIGINKELQRKGYINVLEKGKSLIKSNYRTSFSNMFLTIISLVEILVVGGIYKSLEIALAVSCFTVAFIILTNIIHKFIELEYLTSSYKFLNKE